MRLVRKCFFCTDVMITSHLAIFLLAVDLDCYTRCYNGLLLTKHITILMEGFNFPPLLFCQSSAFLEYTFRIAAPLEENFLKVLT